MRNANARSTTPSLLCTFSIPWYSHGHDAWSKLYESEFFVNWLLGTESDDNATSLGFNV